MSMPVNTAGVKERRTLRFETIDECLGEVDRVVAADRLGKLSLVGNWSLGTILNHLATWTEFSFTGAPTKPPWFVRILAKMMKKKFLYSGHSPGFMIPKTEGGTIGCEPAEVEQALPRLRAALEQLRREPPKKPNTVFGPLTHAEWIALNLRHAELHLGFAVIQD